MKQFAKASMLDEKAEIQQICEEKLERYYQRLGKDILR